MIEKLAKLLALAENAGTPEEAEAFMEKAQLLSSKYSIELAKARSALAKSQKREEPTTRAISVADSGSKTKKLMVELFSAIAHANDLRIDVAHNSTTVYPYGFPTDIDVVEALYASLSRHMVESANEWLATGEYKKETVVKWSDRDWAYVKKPVDARVARASFYRRYISVVRSRLQEGRKQAIAEVEQESGGTELVLADKAHEVSDYYKNSSNARGSWSGSSSSTVSNSAGEAGQRAGSSAKLSGTQKINGGRKELV